MEYWPNKIYNIKVTVERSKTKSHKLPQCIRSCTCKFTIVYLDMANFYRFCVLAQTRFPRSRSQFQGQRSHSANNGIQHKHLEWNICSNIVM